MFTLSLHMVTKAKPGHAGDGLQGSPIGVDAGQAGLGGSWLWMGALCSHSEV